MYPDEKAELGNVLFVSEGKVIGSLERVSATTKISEYENTDVNLIFSNSFEGTLDIEYIDEKLLEQLGLYEFQKTLLRRELRRQQLESVKENKLSMRESINKHFKRGRKW